MVKDGYCNTCCSDTLAPAQAPLLHAWYCSQQRPTTAPTIAPTAASNCSPKLLPLLQRPLPLLKRHLPVHAPTAAHTTQTGLSEASDTALTGMIWHGMVLDGMVWNGRVWYGVEWYGMVQDGMVWGIMDGIYKSMHQQPTIAPTALPLFCSTRCSAHCCSQYTHYHPPVCTAAYILHTQYSIHCSAYCSHFPFAST